MLRLLIITLSFLCFILQPSYSTTYHGTPENYLEKSELLMAGDTLLLASGHYMQTLVLKDKFGTKDSPIVIAGPETGAPATIFGKYGTEGCIYLVRVAFIEIRNLTLEGLTQYANGIGTSRYFDDYTHDVLVEKVIFRNQVSITNNAGIRTTCPSWNWRIRHCQFLHSSAIILGLENGLAPFFSSNIEYNLIQDPRYGGILIHPQVAGSRDAENMPDSAQTIIRYNVISKAGWDIQNSDFANLEVGTFPEYGPGSSDMYLIYGNFLWQNPESPLFRASGRVAFYNNLLVNTFTTDWAIFHLPRHNLEIDKLFIFNNSILADSLGIGIEELDSNKTVFIAGNLVLAENQLHEEASGYHQLNVFDQLEKANEYLINPVLEPGLMDLRPKASLKQSLLDPNIFSDFKDANLDFDGNPRDWHYRGAYTGFYSLMWIPSLQNRPELNEGTTHVNELVPNVLNCYPNPTDNLLVIDFQDTPYQEIYLLSMDGKMKVLTPGNSLLDTKDLQPAYYQVFLSENGRTTGHCSFVKM